MMTTRPFLISTGITTLVFLAGSMAFGAAPPRPLFASHSIIEARIEAPLSTLTRDRPEEEYLEGTFSYRQSDGTDRRFSLELRTRGRYRRQKSTCSFPPVRLNFRTSELVGSEFEGQDKLKLVTHCQNRREQFEQLVLREYLAYRILQTLTDLSFRTRLLRITWQDIDGGEPLIRYGFVIEDDDDIGERLGMEKVKTSGLNYSDLEARQTNLVNVFEYLIGNTDFSLIRGPADDDCCHNAVPFSDGSTIRPVPYDFDFSGLVDAPYAEPNPQFKIRDVRTRLYRGRCSNNGILADTFAYINGKRAEIYALVDELDGLDRKNRLQVTRYLDLFFDDIGNPKTVERRFIKECS